jgi:hypothetical protein
MTIIFPNSQYDTKHLDGRNTDVDAAEDIWSGGGDYTWPAAAAATTIVSSDVADDGSPAGTGALTVTVTGLNASYLLTSETVTMNGTSAVTLTNQYIRILDAFVATAGSGGTNAGTIDIKHSSTILAQIPIGYGVISQATYCVPADYDHAHIIAWHAGMLRTTATLADIGIYIRPFGGAWQLADVALVNHSIVKNNNLYVPLLLAPKTDVRLRALSVTAANADIYGGLHVILWKEANSFYARFDTY